MEKYVKAGIVTGITLTSLSFILLAMPAIIQYGSYAIQTLSSGELESKLKSTPEYQIFKERFQVDEESFVMNSNVAYLTLTASNKTTENILALNMNIPYSEPDSISKSVQCDAVIPTSDIRDYASGYRVKLYLETTTCLD